MPKLVTSANNVMRNIDRYWEGAHGVLELIKDATKARQWKCYKDSDGEWRFGPSRFVGYEDMTPEEYVERKKTSKGGLNGTQTEEHFRQQTWTTLVPEDSILHRELTDKLKTFLARSDKGLNASAQFAILGTVEADIDTQDIDAERVDALTTLAAHLPLAYLQRLRRNLISLEREQLNKN